MTVSVRTATVIAASVSFAFSVCTILFLIIFPNWRNRPASVKHVLLFLTLNAIVASANYFIPEGHLCKFQASVMQFFEVGGWLWATILAIDLARELYSSLTRLRGSPQLSIFDVQRHHIVYHSFSLTYQIVSTVVMTVLDLREPAGAWCWTTSKDWAWITYGTLWVLYTVIVISMIFIFWMVKRATLELSIMEKKGVVSGRRAMRNRMRWQLIIRLVMIPLFYCALHIPGSMNRLGNYGDNDTVQYMQGIFDPSQGTVNFLVFILADTSLHREMRQKWKEWQLEKKFTTFLQKIGCMSGFRKNKYPLSEVDDKEEDIGQLEDLMDFDDDSDRFTLTDRDGNSLLFSRRSEQLSIELTDN